MHLWHIIYGIVLMDTLFSIEPGIPEGFHYFPDFLTQAEELELIMEIEKIPLSALIFQGFEAKRKIASFGYDWSFERRSLSKGKDIPDTFKPLLQKAANRLNLNPEDIAEVLLTEYPMGSVINWHRDAPPFDTIAGISLLSDCTFRFRPHDTTQQGRSAIISLAVKRRSLYVIQGVSRTDWQHRISPVKNVRYSITLRTLKPAFNFH